MKRRSIPIMAATFAVVLAAGVALAQVGAYAPSFFDLNEEADKLASELREEVKEPDAVEEPDEYPAEEEPDKSVAAEEPQKKDPMEGEPDEPVDNPEKEPVDEPSDTTPPELVITNPEDGAHFGEKTLKFAGVTEPGARVFAGKYEADVFDNGEWHIVLILSPGRNVVKFMAKDAAGNVADAAVTAYLDVSDTTFTAHQKYGTNSEPWEKFYGTAAKGTVIELMSKHGTARTVVEGTEWALKLHFEGLKGATSLPIVLETSTGERMEFKFNYEPKDVQFTAHQKYGVSAEPWEKFYGTAVPGTVIELGSDYGEARLVTEGYEWSLKLHFESLAEATSFPIVLHTSTGEVMDFMFTYDPQPIEFSAYQQYGSCSDPEPYDVFHGTAAPGATITVTSDFGSGSTVAGDLGKWDLKVFFAGTTHGEGFVVTVKDSEGHQKHFEFVSYAGGDA